MKSIWISIYDKSPPEDEFILCLLEDGSQTVLKYVGDKTYVPLIPYDPAWIQFNTLHRVSHWMPLPKGIE